MLLLELFRRNLYSPLSSIQYISKIGPIHTYLSITVVLNKIMKWPAGSCLFKVDNQNAKKQGVKYVQS